MPFGQRVFRLVALAIPQVIACGLARDFSAFLVFEIDYFVILLKLFLLRCLHQPIGRSNLKSHTWRILNYFISLMN